MDKIESVIPENTKTVPENEVSVSETIIKIDSSETCSIPINFEDIENCLEDEPDNQKVSSSNKKKKKIPAKGMMDIALITANANQLRYLLEYNQASPTFVLNLILVTISLLLQVAVGISLILKSKIKTKGQPNDPTATRLHNYVLIGIFLITVLNVFIASFTVTTAQSKVYFSQPHHISE